MTNTIKLMLAGMTVAVLACATAPAAIIAINDWESGAEGWTIENADTPPPSNYGTLTDPAVLGGENALQVTADTTGIPGVIRDLIYASGANSLVTSGGYDLPWAAVEFDFYAGAGGATFDEPAELRLFFVYDAGGAGEMVWYYDVNVTGASGWDSYWVDMEYSAGWYNMGGFNTEANFLTALTDVDQIGFMLTYQPNLAGQTYGFDNVTLSVPEPEEYAVLAFALVSLCIVFRKRLNESLSAVRLLSR